MSFRIINLAIAKSNELNNSYELFYKQLMHDLQSPISTLNICVSLMKKNSSDTHDEVLQITNLAIERIIELTSNQKITLDKFSPYECLTKIANEVNFQKKIKTFIVCDSSFNFNFTTLGNAAQFKNILSNLINNSVNANASEIKFLLSNKKNYLLFHIFDNGTGISEETLSFVGKTGLSLQKFKTAGQGLGLSHAAKNIKKWGGSIGIKSKVNVGTEIQIVLRHNSI